MGSFISDNVKACRKAKNKAALEKFKTQADVLVYTHEAAILVGGTPTDCPEDVEISPFDRTVYIALQIMVVMVISMVILQDLLKKVVIWFS